MALILTGTPPDHYWWDDHDDDWDQEEYDPFDPENTNPTCNQVTP